MDSVFVDFLAIFHQILRVFNNRFRSKTPSEQSQIQIFHSAREKKSGMWVSAPFARNKKLLPPLTIRPTPARHEGLGCLLGC
jgi:hypothetical protein